MRRLLFALIASSAVFACSAGEPETGFGNPSGPDAGLDELPPEERGVPLSFAGLPPSTPWDTVPVHGQGPRNGTVIIEANGNAVSVELGSDGSFCLDVPLNDGPNELSLVAIDEVGERSNPKAASIVKQGDPPAPGEATPAENIALGGRLGAESTIYVHDGEEASISDGNPLTGAYLGNAVFSSDYFMMQMPQAQGAVKIRLLSDPECPATEFIMATSEALVTDMEEPPTTNADVGPWKYVGHAGGETPDRVTDCTTNDATVCHEFEFDAAVVGALGMRVLESGCSSWRGNGLNYIREIEVWSPAGVAPPDVAAPSCQGGL